ncbi:MAG: hypothetical protein IPL70_00140 [Uliginosibacterium sp.]|nr:hypothetical protein [Uliginosibacterium sp.]
MPRVLNGYGAYDGTEKIAIELRKSASSVSPYLLGAVVPGSVSKPEELSCYRFTISDPQTAWMNVAGDQYLVSLVRRQDNSFVLKDKDVSNSDIRELMKLDSGDYELQLRPKSSLLSGFGSFQFQIQTRDALPELSV